MKLEGSVVGGARQAVVREAAERRDEVAVFEGAGRVEGSAPKPNSIVFSGARESAALERQQSPHAPSWRQITSPPRRRTSPDAVPTATRRPQTERLLLVVAGLYPRRAAGFAAGLDGRLDGIRKHKL